MFTTFEGDNTVLLQLVAKTVLSGHGTRVGRLDLLGKARFAARLVGDAVVERTGVRPLLDRGDVRDPAVQRRLLVAREEHLVASAAQRMRRALAPGADRFAVFNGAQDHLLAAARAHVERIVFDSFAAVADRHPLLGRLLVLHGLSVVDADRAWFVEHGYLGAGRTKTLVTAVNELCGELRPHARELVDAFGIPERWLACPMLDGEHGAAAPVEAGPAELAAVG